MPFISYICTYVAVNLHIHIYTYVTELLQFCRHNVILYKNISGCHVDLRCAVATEVSAASVIECCSVPTRGSFRNPTTGTCQPCRRPAGPGNVHNYHG